MHYRTTFLKTLVLERGCPSGLAAFVRCCRGGSALLQWPKGEWSLQPASVRSALTVFAVSVNRCVLGGLLQPFFDTAVSPCTRGAIYIHGSEYCSCPLLCRYRLGAPVMCRQRFRGELMYRRTSLSASMRCFICSAVQFICAFSFVTFLLV